METVNVRKLKNELSRYVERARCGERITVTRRGLPVADLVPYAPNGLDPEDELIRLARSGEVRLGRPHAGSTANLPPLKAKLPDDELASLLHWVRGDR